MSVPRAGVLAAAVVLGAGCAAPGPAPPLPSPAPRAAPAAGSVSVGRVAALERELGERAQADAAAGRWADAVTRREILVLLRPDSEAHRRELEDARRAAAAAAANHLRAAQAARSRRNADQAGLAYLKALAADPDNAAAIEGLRALEAERVTRAWLNRPPRVPYPPPGQPSPYDPTTDEGTAAKR